MDRFAAACRAAAAPVVQQSIDVSYPPGPQQQTRRTHGQTDRHRAVSQTLLRNLHTMRTVSLLKSDGHSWISTRTIKPTIINQRSTY